VYALSYAGAGAILWRMARFPIAMRIAGLGLLAAGVCWMFTLPFVLGGSVAQMTPFFNLGLLAFILLSVILYFSCSVNTGTPFDGFAKKVILAGFITALFIAFHLASGTVFQAGHAFSLFFAFTLNQGIVSILGFAGFGLGLLLWKKGLATTAFAVMNIEIAACLGSPGETFSLLASENYMKLLAYSIGWMAFAITMLVTGIRFSLPLCRWVATGLICITVVKVFIADTAKLDMGYKIASFSILSLGLFFVAYLYQKFISDEPQKRKQNSSQ